MLSNVLVHLHLGPHLTFYVCMNLSLSLGLGVLRDVCGVYADVGRSKVEYKWKFAKYPYSSFPLFKSQGKVGYILLYLYFVDVNIMIMIMISPCTACGATTTNLN